MKYIIAFESFYVLTGALIVFLALETVWPGVVLAYINYNIVLLLWFVNGIVILLNTKAKNG